MADAVPTASPDDEEITALVDAAMKAHLEGGDTGLEEFCSRLDRHRDVVLRRLSALRRVGLLGDAAASSPTVPERVGDFELIEPLGRGGMGVVYRARQVTLDREVAVKLIRPEQLLFPGVRERFRREIAIVAKLQNDGVVRLYSFGEDRGIPWFAMELVRGASLAQVIETLAAKRGQPLSGADLAACLPAPPAGAEAKLFEGQWTDVALRIVERVAQALDEAHQQGVLHRDIKPSNIMLTAAGRVVLLDFGLAWSHGADRLTRTGSELGTIHYMAPEQFARSYANVDERTDVYALGVVLRELVTLRSVFTGATVDEVARQVREGRLAPFGGHRSSVARDVETVCLVAMDREPHRRYASARLFARDLRRVLERRPLEAVRPGLGLRLRRFAQRHRAASIAAVVAAVALLFTPLAVALHERELRLQLESEVARADQNLGLATGAIEETLTRLGAERVTVVPDLRAFVNGALASSAAFIDGLATSNPADPAARLRLAQTLAKVAFVQWSYFNLERTEPLFTRTLQLLEGAEASDRAAELELEVRLALVYVQRLDASASVAAYRTALDRACVLGPVEGRSLRLRTLVARCLDRCGGTLQRRGDAAGLPMIREAARLRDGIVLQAPNAEAWIEVALSNSSLAADSQTRDAGEKARSEARCDEAIAAAELLADTMSMDDSERFLSVVVQRTTELASQPGRQIELLERAERFASKRHAQRPSRLSELYNWVGMAWRLAEAYERGGRLPDAVAKAQQATRSMRAATILWPYESGPMRSCMSSLRSLAQLGLRQPAGGDPAPGTAIDTAIDVDELLAEAVAIAKRAESAEPRRAPTLDECNRVFAERSKRRLRTGDVDGALADATEAERFFLLAKHCAQDDRMRLVDDPTPRLLQAEACLRLGRDDDALARLRAFDKFPRGALDLVPTLLAREHDQRFATIVQRARAEN